MSCSCERWSFYVKNYNEVFYWDAEFKKWYVRWVHLADQGGYTQVSRYAIPIKFCPLCGGRLINPEEEA